MLTETHYRLPGRRRWTCGEGRAVSRSRHGGDPARLAAAHSGPRGPTEIVLLDITATHEGRDTLVETVRRTARELFIPFTVGGGIRTLDDATANLMWAPTR